MSTQVFDRREQKARDILASNGVKIINREHRLFAVASQSGHDPYRVNLELGACQCVDFVERGVECKHIKAARMFEQRDAVLTGNTVIAETPKPRTYAELFVVLHLTPA